MVTQADLSALARMRREGPGGNLQSKPLVSFSESSCAKRRVVKAPDEGPFFKVKSVLDIYKQIRSFVGMVSNVWSLTAATTTPFKMALPGLMRVVSGHEVFTVPSFLLQEFEVAADTPFSPALSSPPPDGLGGGGGAGGAGSRPGSRDLVVRRVHEVRLRYATPYFSQILLLVKMRWLLRLHSACCELDYRVCSLKNILLGMQFVVLQHHADVECDSIFDTKVPQQTGAFLNLDSLFDDIVDQLQKALGVAWRPFLEFVSSCDASKAMHSSILDGLAPPKVVFTDDLAVVVDTIFLASFLRQSMRGPAGKLQELMEDCREYGLAALDIPPLRGARDLIVWASARTKPTLAARGKAGRQQAEKLAQLDAVLLTAACELRRPEVMASELEAAESRERGENDAASEAASSPKNQRQSLGASAGGRPPPPAARLIPQIRPVLAPGMLEAAVDCVHHHHSFPDGIRERLYRILAEEYFLTRDQSERLAIASTQNIDGKRLSEATLLQIVHKEHTRLRKYQADVWVDTNHCLKPALVGCPSDIGKPPRHLRNSASDSSLLRVSWRRSSRPHTH